MFLILDVPDIDRDMALARHVTFVHKNEGLEERQDDFDSDDEKEGNVVAVDKSDFDEEKGIVSPQLLREYITRARRHDPWSLLKLLLILLKHTCLFVCRTDQG